MAHTTEEQAILSQVLIRLAHALQALASPADAQMRLFPATVCTGDELALDYAHWAEWVLRNPAAVVTPEQRRLLVALDHRLATMSGEANRELWTDEALQTRPEWSEIRSLAQETLAAFGWPVTIPPSYRQEFITGSDDDTVA